MTRPRKKKSTPTRPEDLLRGNAEDFLNSGIRLLFCDEPSEGEAKLAIVSIQVAAELFAKHRIVKTGGLAKIVRGSLPSGSIQKAAQAGRFKTIGYGECLAIIGDEESFTEGDRDVLQALQNLRNSLVHFSAQLDIQDVRMKSAWMLIRVLAMFAAAEDRDVGEFQTHAQFLDPDNYRQLIGFGPYRQEAVDAAQESWGSQEVLRCWECGEHTLSVRVSEALFCWCCGLTVDASVVEHEDCRLCASDKGVFFDPHNLTSGCYRGRCTECDTFVWLRHCDECGTISMVPEKMGPSPCLTCVN